MLKSGHRVPKANIVCQFKTYYIHIHTEVPPNLKKQGIDRVEEGLEAEVIHVMFYNKVYVVALGPSSVYLFITPAKSRETYYVQCIHLRATPITESHTP